MNDLFNSATRAFSSRKITSKNGPIAIVTDLDTGEKYEVFDSLAEFHKNNPNVKNASAIPCNQARNQ